MKTIIWLCTTFSVATAIASVAYAQDKGDKQYMDDMDAIVYGHPVFNGFRPPIMAGDDESKAEDLAPVPYLNQPRLHGPLTANERIDAGHAAFEYKQNDRND